MADVNGTNYNKMYVEEPKRLGDAGLQHVKPRKLADLVTGSAGDRYFIGELPEDAIILSVSLFDAAGTGTVDAIELLEEDGSFTAIALGEVLEHDRLPLAITVGTNAMADELIVVEYIQC